MKTIRYQKRDILLLLLLSQVVLMETSMIRARLFPNDRTGEACLRRLRLLLAHGLIARLSFPVVSVSDEPGHLLTLYRLTSHGAEVLAAHTGTGPKRLLRTAPRPKTLLHRRDLARVMLAVNDAAAAASLPEPQWILEQDMHPGLPPEATRAERFILYEDFQQADGQIVQLRPDASTLLRFPAQVGNGHAPWHDLLVWWEIDRSTEGLTQISAKVIALDILLKQHEPKDPSRRLYRRHWPHVEKATLRVFFVCPSVQHIQTISCAIRQLPGAEYVRLATLDSITPARFLADAIWHDVNGERRAIFPSALSGK